MAVDGTKNIVNGGLTLQDEIRINEIPVPTEPLKSSSEILSELFSAFNAEPPVLPDIIIQRHIDSPKSSDESEKHIKKHGKKRKKKHKKEKKTKRSSSRESGSTDERKIKKHKTSKKKKKSKIKVDSESDSSETQNNSIQKKKKHKRCDSDSDEGPCEKKHKHKRKKSRKNSPECVQNKGDHGKVNGNIKETKGTVSEKNMLDISEIKSKENLNMIKEELKNVFIYDISKTIDKVFESVPLIVKKEESSMENKSNSNMLPCNDEHVDNCAIDKSSCCEGESGKVEDKVLMVSEPENIPLPVADVFVEDLLDSGVKKEQLKMVPDKPKASTGKIIIKNLKHSTVFEETVRQVEEQAKLKAEKYEEGELSDSTEQQPSSSPSPEPSSGSAVESLDEVKHENSSKSRHSHHRRHHHHRRHRKSRKDDDRAQSCERPGEAKRSGYSSSHSHHRDRSRSSQRSKSPHRSKPEHKNKHRDKEEKVRHKSGDKDRVRSRSRHRDYSRDRYKSHHRHSRSWRSRSQSREKGSSGVLEEGIDKQKLLEIARKNALNMLKVPTGGTDSAKVAITSGGKTVDELTDFCKLLSKKDADGHESISSNTSESSDSENEKPFHHPFLIKDRPSNIVMNIRNSVPLPVKTMQEKTVEQSRQLRILFPVSSGQQHRKTENEWVPVSPKKDEPVVPTIPVAVVKPAVKLTPPPPVQNVFQQPPDVQNLDIGSLIAQRLAAMRKLQENPNDVEALNGMYRAQSEMQAWAESKQQPGQFTGSTGVKVLSQAELSSGVQAWARRDQLQSAAPVSGGMGMALLQKMGWRPGEGLGKNKEGTLQPLMLEVKMDKKGLVAQEELPCRPPNVTARGTVKHYEGKHPASMLNEYCSRNRIGPPYFELCFEGGPDHKKHFLFKVKVNGVEYKPTVGSPSKKQARAEAAALCLRELGVLASN